MFPSYTYFCGEYVISLQFLSVNVSLLISAWHSANLLAELVPLKLHVVSCCFTIIYRNLLFFLLYKTYTFLFIFFMSIQYGKKLFFQKIPVFLFRSMAVSVSRNVRMEWSFVENDLLSEKNSLFYPPIILYLFYFYSSFCLQPSKFSFYSTQFWQCTNEMQCLWWRLAFLKLWNTLQHIQLQTFKAMISKALNLVSSLPQTLQS